MDQGTKVIVTDGKINGFRVNMLVTFVLGGDSRFSLGLSQRSRQHALTQLSGCCRLWYLDKASASHVIDITIDRHTAGNERMRPDPSHIADDAVRLNS